MIPPWLLEQAYAHRGRSRPGDIENSLDAFQGACSAGLGFELDVHLGADGTVLVHHDADLRRVAGDPRRIAELTVADARRVRLDGSSQHLPALFEVLELVSGAVPVLVEVKPQPHPIGDLERQVADVLQRYPGPAAVIGFDPHQLAWFATHAPSIARGQTCGGTVEDAWLPTEQMERINALEVLTLSQPDFLVHNIRRLDAARITALRQLELPVIGWTVTDPADLPDARQKTDQLIVACFDPGTDGGTQGSPEPLRRNR